MDRCSWIALLPILAFPAIGQPLLAPGFEREFANREVEWRDAVLPFITRQRAVASVDSEATQYVSALGTWLTYATPQPVSLQSRFILYDDAVGLQVPILGLLKQTHQIQTLPGGLVLVPMSLFAAAADEAEFSAALARGIAHIMLRHWMRELMRLSFLSPWAPGPKMVLFPRSFERGADRTAVAILARSGWNPEALVRLAQDIQASFDRSSERVEFIRKAISDLPPFPYGPDRSIQFDILKTRVSAAPVKL
jgi:hypothetical protein